MKQAAKPQQSKGFAKPSVRGCFDLFLWSTDRVNTGLCFTATPIRACRHVSTDVWNQTLRPACPVFLLKPRVCKLILMQLYIHFQAVTLRQLCLTSLLGTSFFFWVIYEDFLQSIHRKCSFLWHVKIIMLVFIFLVLRTDTFLYIFFWIPLLQLLLHGSERRKAQWNPEEKFSP